MTGSLVVVTDSTAGLAAPVAARAGVEVVPLHVVVGDDEFTEGVDVDRTALAASLRKGRVSTSRPSPLAFLTLYERLAQEGATRIVSAHLSAQLSGTCEAARLAARVAPVPVRVVDTGSIALALGYAVLAGAEAARRVPAGVEATQEEAADVADLITRRAAASQVLVYVHTLEYLRRGGRIGAAASLLGGALAVKPLVALVDGHLEPVEKLRTASRALARLVDLTVHAATVAPGPVRLAVQHVEADARAASVAAELRAHLPGVEVEVAEVTAVVGVHLGPGMVATVVAPSTD
ncbi:DegV family protein [Agilicoccus flavus]|uniref:DegV family protein n=1 Tax=Agilicoccus flavus TaxID=2775968 RepID=UPI001CF69489|nr:DegV family protein [Agilicoccus flavus]